MGRLDEQIRDRKQNDDGAFAEAFSNMASAVMGKRIEASLNDDRTVTKDAIDEILKYYHVKSREVPDNISDMNEQLEYYHRNMEKKADSGDFLVQIGHDSAHLLCQKVYLEF